MAERPEPREPFGLANRLSPKPWPGFLEDIANCRGSLSSRPQGSGGVGCERKGGSQRSTREEAAAEESQSAVVLEFGHENKNPY